MWALILWVPLATLLMAVLSVPRNGDAPSKGTRSCLSSKPWKSTKNHQKKQQLPLLAFCRLSWLRWFCWVCWLCWLCLTARIDTPSLMPDTGLDYSIWFHSRGMLCGCAETLRRSHSIVSLIGWVLSVETNSRPHFFVSCPAPFPQPLSNCFFYCLVQ